MGVTPLVTACSIVRDEQANLPGCMDAAAGLVDEWLVGVIARRWFW